MIAKLLLFRRALAAFLEAAGKDQLTQSKPKVEYKPDYRNRLYGSVKYLEDE